MTIYGVCKICKGRIKQSPVTGGWFHLNALPLVHSEPMPQADDLTAVAEAVGVLR